MVSASASENLVQRLPNNASLVRTRLGGILVNCPPETLKALLAYGYEPPAVVVVPPDAPAGRELGSSGFVYRGINYASVEFVLYARFFSSGRLTTLITPTVRQAERLGVILEETLSGPPAAAYGEKGWLRQECLETSYFPPLGRSPTTSDMVHIRSLEAEGGDLGQGVSLTLDGDRLYVYQDGALLATASVAIENPAQPLLVTPARPLLRHALTLQFIGGSDGFDPTGITTCFLAYLRPDDDRPTLFDTAAYLRQRLAGIGVAPQQIAEIVLSHLHEDHLAGLPELLLLSERRMRLLTSDLIYESLLRVLSAMLNLPQENVAALFDWVPLNPDRPVTLEERTFHAIYAVHTIPTIAVRVNGLCYSGDMRYDEEWFAELEAAAVLSPARRQALENFAAGAAVLVQDAGGGTIHTAITPDILAALAAKAGRIVLAHTRRSKLSLDDSRLRDRIEFASSGHITALGERAPTTAESNRRLATLCASPLFSRLTAGERLALAEAATQFTFEMGETIIRDGEPPDGWTYIVHFGLVALEDESGMRMTIGRGSILGERATLRGVARINSLIARSTVRLLGFPEPIFQAVARELHLAQALDRADWLWRETGPLFRDVLWSTMLDLALDFTPRTLAAGESLFNAGDPGDESYVLVRGAINVLDGAGDVIDEMRVPGTFFGGRATLYNAPRNAGAVATLPSEVWTLSQSGLQRFQMVYPRLMLHMHVVESPRLGRLTHTQNPGAWEAPGL